MRSLVTRRTTARFSPSRGRTRSCPPHSREAPSPAPRLPLNPPFACRGYELIHRQLEPEAGYVLLFSRGSRNVAVSPCGASHATSLAWNMKKPSMSRRDIARLRGPHALRSSRTVTRALRAESYRRTWSRDGLVRHVD